MSKSVRIIGVVIVVLLAMQLVPIARDNPDDRRQPPGSPEVLAVLRRACFNCHSHETVWPAYSRVAPISWVIAHDVSEGREVFNLSNLADISAETQVKVKAKAVEVVESGEMPPFQYVLMHPEAKLTEQDKAVIRTWK